MALGRVLERAREGAGHRDVGADRRGRRLHRVEVGIERRQADAADIADLAGLRDLGREQAREVAAEIVVVGNRHHVRHRRLEGVAEDLDELGVGIGRRERLDRLGDLVEGRRRSPWRRHRRGSGRSTGRWPSPAHRWCGSGSPSPRRASSAPRSSSRSGRCRRPPGCGPAPPARLPARRASFGSARLPAPASAAAPSEPCRKCRRDMLSVLNSPIFLVMTLPSPCSRAVSRRASQTRPMRDSCRLSGRRRRERRRPQDLALLRFDRVHRPDLLHVLLPLRIGAHRRPPAVAIVEAIENPE